MKSFIKMFTDSAREFKNLRSVVTVALLVALHTVMALFLSIQVTTSLRISISFLANCIIGCMYGPVMGFAAAGLGDIIQFVLKPTGPYFIGWTINAALAGLIYGCFFYGKAPKILERSNEDKKKNAAREKKAGRIETVLNIAAAAVSAAAAGVMIAAPFLQITMKGADGSVSQARGSASTLLFSGNASTNAVIVAVIGFVVSIVLFITPWLKWYKTSLTVSVIGTFVMILSVYADKKTTTALAGFWLVCVLLITYAVVQVAQVAGKHSMDFSFLIRCVIALTFDTILVNILLGTYWVSFMYGKGFAFYLTSRLIKNMVQLPINIMLTYYVLGMVRRVRIHK